LEWVKTYFGTIPAGPEVGKPAKDAVTLDEDRYISLEDNIQLPELNMVWPTVSANHPDEAPLDVLQDIMGGGQTSLLYKNLQKPGLAVAAVNFHRCQEISCTFHILVRPNPRKVKGLAEIETIVRDSFKEFEERGVEDDDLTRVKSSIVSGLIYGLESVSGKITQLAAYETYRDNPNGIGDDIARYESVTKADVMRVYNKYIKNKPAVIMSIVPKGKPEMIAAADTWDRYERTIPNNSGDSSDFSWTRPADPEGLDRSQVPPAGANNPSIKAPNTYTFSVGDGIEVLGARNTEVPTTTISLRIKAGQSHEALGKLGLASMTAGLLNEATLKRTAEEISNDLAKLGSSVSFNSGDTFSTMRVRTLTKNLDATMAIAMERLTQPKFDQIASVIAVSDLNEAAMKKALAPLSEWSGGDVPAADMKPFPELDTGTLYFVDKPDAAQSEIRIGKRALPYDATGEYYRSTLMNFPIGGAFNSRINLNLREDKGYTYGARSFFNGDEKAGWYRAGAAVRADSTAASITEFVNEIKSSTSTLMK